MTTKFKHVLDSIDPFASRFIRGKVRQLVELPGFHKGDREDLFHDFALDLLQRRRAFDPASGSWEAFVIVVCENRFAALLDHRKAKKRTDQCEGRSLNESVHDDEGRCVEVGDSVPESQSDRRTRIRRRSAVEASELFLDMADVIASLPPQLRDLCSMLKQGSVKSAAQAMGVSRPTIYARIRILRRLFENAGLRDYL